MKCFWVINIGRNPSKYTIRSILEKLEYTKIDHIMDVFFFVGSDPIVYLKNHNKIIFHKKWGIFAWDEFEDFEMVKKCGEEYKGEISLRKEKLKKLNEKFK
jgi:hypothetical protein